MSIFDSISRTVKNVFVGSHKGEDINLDVLQDDPLPVKNTRTVGIGTNRYHPDPNFSPDTSYQVPSFDMEVSNTPEAGCTTRKNQLTDVTDWFEDDKPKEQGPKTLHQHMYEIATARYNPFSLGGSENCDSDVTCNIGGSENLTRSESPDKNT